jgi:6-phosphogluconolactonase
MSLPTARVLAGLVLTATAALAADPPASGKYWVYFGTYTGGKGGSKGIYRCEFDVKTGKLTKPEVAAELTNPTFVAIAPSGQTLYSIGETSDAGKKKNEGGVFAFRLDPATGALTKLSENTSGGPGPCHISTDKAGQFALVANYGGGSCAVFKLNPDGGIAARTDFKQHKGTGKDPGRQAGPHTHCGYFDETGHYALVVDLGVDRVFVYKLDRDTGKITEVNAIKMPAGSGPRHVHIAPGNDRAFVCGELDSTVSVVNLDFAHDKTAVVQTLSTLPGGKPVPGNSTAEVRIHPNGKFVYVSNRGHNSIAAFSWDGTKLTPIGHATAGIKTPRNFRIDPTGRWMLVANQDGNDVAVFEIGADGLPKPAGHTVPVPMPVCVKFLAKP